MNKKTMKIIVAIIITILVIILGVFTMKIITTNIKIKETEQKLSEIDAEELKTKLIEELKKTKLNVSVDLIDTNNMFVETMFADSENFKGYVTATTICFKGYNVVGAVETPCFKINSDNNGKLKNIEYTEKFMDGVYIIEKAVKDVFKNEYNIEFTIKNSTYNKKFNKLLRDFTDTNKGDIYVKDNDFLLGIAEKITGIAEYDYSDSTRLKEYRTTTFGLDF